MNGKDKSILDTMDEKTKYLTPIFGSEATDAPMPSQSLNDDPVDPGVAYEMIREYLSIEGNATQNSATFCQTYMEPMATRLMSENLMKNAIDKDEYPMTADLENRCVSILQDLWNADSDENPLGTSTVGSSEACMLGGLSMFFRWKKLADAAGIDRFSRKRPNLVISSGYQVCWEKFCRYWDIEMRLVPLDEEHLSLNTETVMGFVDEYTIGIVAILGITYTGKFDDVAKLDELVGEYNKAHSDMPIRIHVDGASGAMVAPFIEPDLKWDFRCKNVWSINTSGHKYGLVYPGVGWIIWRSKDALPEDLIFWVSYLGGDEATMSINFSRSASQIVGQYYVFMRNGFMGFREIHQRTLDVARYMAHEIEGMELFEIHEDAKQIPIVCWGLKEDAGVQWSLYDLADRLRMSGWLVPAYPLPENLQHMDVQRLVVRQDFSMPLAIRLIADMKKEIENLDNGRVIVGKQGRKSASGFDHGGRSIG
jgi:glutamate decarboxylase